MARASRVPRTIVGEAEFRSRFLSNRWVLRSRGETLAEMFRVPSRHVSEAKIVNGPTVEIEPTEWGTVTATADGSEFGRIERRSWWGRSWDLVAQGFACELRSEPLPRRWTLRLGSEPVGRLTGGVLSYNRLHVSTDISIPITGLILIWHVLARPWEQAATPGVLVPQRPEPRSSL